MLRTDEFGNGTLAAAIAIGHGTAGHDEFLRGNYWRDETGATGPFSDPEPEMAAYRLFRLARGQASNVLNFQALRHALGARAKSNLGASGGDAWTLGGTFVIDVDSGELLYEHRQANYTDHPKIEDIISTCTGGVTGEA